MKIVLFILAILVGVILLMALVGAILPRTHEVARSAAYRRTPAEVYSVIRDFAATPSWRSGVTGVDIVPPRDGRFSTEPNGSRVRITERGEVRNVIFRFMARFVFGYTATMETYLKDLGGKLGETVTPSS
jgi:hypothetical protein